MMNQWKSILLSCVLLSCVITSESNALTQSWYSIAFDVSGNKVDTSYTHPYIADTVITSTGDGYNNTWYYYPYSKEYP